VLATVARATMPAIRYGMVRQLGWAVHGKKVRAEAYLRSLQDVSG
jgi:hypothetical protein